ncbi:MAG: helix-turn-helix domain-containing protein [Leucobacter sp.]
MNYVVSATVSRLATWQQLAGRLFAPLQLRSNARRFEASYEQRNIVRGLDVTRLCIAPHSSERTPALTADGVDDVMLLIPSADADCVLTEHDRTIPLPAESVTLIDFGSPFTLEVRDHMTDFSVVQFSRRLLRVPRTTLAHVRGRPIGSAVPAQETLRAMLSTLHRPQATRDRDTAAQLADVAVQLATTVMHAFLSWEDTEPPTREARLEELRTSMRRQIADPTLTVERLAAQHFLSVRQVHALFAEQRDSPGAYLRRIRMERAAQMLAVRDRTGLTVQSIAHENGYADAAAFSRAFAREHGMRPGRWTASR